MSTALAVQPPTGTAPPLDGLFDFAAAHARVTHRLRRALDGNGAAGSDMETVSRWERVEGAVVNLDASVSWTSSRRTYAGKLTGNISYVNEADLEVAYRQHFNAYSEQPRHVDRVVADLSASPAAGFASEAEVDLGAIPLSFASQCHCDSCSGYGQVPCTNCYSGRVTCMTCYGKQRVWTGSSYIACPMHCMRGQVYCPACFGATRLRCSPCEGKGIFTTVWTGRIHAKVSYGIGTPPGRDEAWTKVLTKSGHAWLAEAGFVGKPTVRKGKGCTTIAWTVEVPVLGQIFRIGGKEHKSQYVGRRDRIWSLPRYLDDLLQPIAEKIGTAQPAEAFKLAEQIPVFADVRRGVLHSPRTDEDVSSDYENAVSPTILAEVRNRLEINRDRIARSTISTVWKYAAFALTAGALVALASGRTRSMLGSILPEMQRTATNGEVAFIGGLLLMALMGATWLLAGLAGRSAVRSVLQTKVDRLPQQGRTPIYACIAAFLAYAAGAYVLAPRVEAAPARTAAGVHVPAPKLEKTPRGPQSCRICRGCPRSGPRPYRRSTAEPGRPVGRSGSGLYPRGKLGQGTQGHPAILGPTSRRGAATNVRSDQLAGAGE